jgi:hypothetical protein
MSHSEPESTFSALKQLFPGLSEAQYAKLDAWYIGYAALIFRMYERITSDPEVYARFLTLTNREPRPSITEKVDSPNETTYA